MSSLSASCCQEKRDLEEKVFAAQTRSKNLEHRCQELEESRCMTRLWPGASEVNEGS